MMPTRPSPPLPLRGWTVVSLRPRGQHASLRAAAARQGARTLALPPFAIAPVTDPAVRKMLAQALDADIVLYTSPNAVAAAQALVTLGTRRGQQVLAVGAGTRRALRRHGVDARSPERMDSEGLLALPLLGDVAGRRIGLVTGQGGRNLLAPALRARGATVTRADLYARMPLAPAPVALARLHAALQAPRHVLLALSSGEALQWALAQLPGDAQAGLRRSAVSAASERLADAARDAGFRRIAVATSARPAALLRAAVDAFADHAIV